MTHSREEASRAQDIPAAASAKDTPSHSTSEHTAHDRLLGQAALLFVEDLTPGRFNSAREWLSENCEYSYGQEILRGDLIIQSFVENHKKAAQKLDRIEYLTGRVEWIRGQTVSIVVTDLLFKNQQTHAYRDRLMITFNNSPGPRSVVRIENVRIDGERERLLQFFSGCGIE